MIKGPDSETFYNPEQFNPQKFGDYFKQVQALFLRIAAIKKNPGAQKIPKMPELVKQALDIILAPDIQIELNRVFAPKFLLPEEQKAYEKLEKDKTFGFTEKEGGFKSLDDISKQLNGWNYAGASHFKLLGAIDNMRKTGAVPEHLDEDISSGLRGKLIEQVEKVKIILKELEGKK